MKTTLTIAFAVVALNTFAQEEEAISPFELQSDLDAVNEHFSGVATFRLDTKDRLVIDLFDGGNNYRRDMAYVEFLKADQFTFEAGSNCMVLKCTESTPKCFDKQVMKTGAISPSGRSTIPIPGGDPEGHEAIALVAKLVRDKQQIQRDEANVTPETRPRKK
jgi:hypothetical protein